MKEYRCVKPLRVEQYDEEGYWQPCAQIEVKEGTMFRESTDPLLIARPPGIRLDNGEIWLEVMPSTLVEHFEEVRK